MLRDPNECSKELSKKLSKRWHLLGPDAIEMSQKPPNVSHKNINSHPNLQAATSFLPAALIPTYENRTGIAVTAIAPQLENPFASIEINLQTQTSSVSLTWRLKLFNKCNHYTKHALFSKILL